MRDDYNEKTMLGEKVIGYICLDTKEDSIDDKEYVYIDVCESIALPNRDDRKEEPIIYKVEGTSRVKEYYSTYCGRCYYLCDDIKVIRKLTRDEIIESARGSNSHVNRLISFYPLREEDGVKLANMYKMDFYVLNSLNDIFSSNEEIKKLYENAKEIHLCDKSKVKRYINN